MRARAGTLPKRPNRGIIGRWPVLILLVCWCAEAAPLSLEKCYGPYRILPYIEVAAALQALPKDDRIDQLWEWAGPGYGFAYSDEYPHEQIYILCELLFQSRQAGNSLVPRMRGYPHFIGEPISFGETPDGRARAPMFWVEDIPFRLLHSYSFARMRVPARVYLDYCIRNADWTARDFSKVDIRSIPAAYERLLELQPWSRPLTDSEHKFLADQLLPHQPSALGAPGVVVVVKKHNAHSIIGKPVGGAPLVLAADEKIGVMAGGGKRPYRYTLTVSNPEQPEPQVVDEGAGRDRVVNPFAREMIEPRWPEVTAGDELVFQLVDSAGAGHALYFRVVAPNTFQVSRWQPVGALSTP